MRFLMHRKPVVGLREGHDQKHLSVCQDIFEAKKNLHFEEGKKKACYCCVDFKIKAAL